MSERPGRSCPIRYRYGPQALKEAPETPADILYVIGGLYGNPCALDTILELAQREDGPVTLCFNGDFNWFNIDDHGFAGINEVVFAHDACLGNVEAELFAHGDDAGCGCGYPERVNPGVVQRSNQIHSNLKSTAQRHPKVIEQLASLPMVRRYKVGGLAIGVVHGDAESLAGWRFDVAALDDAKNHHWLSRSFELANVGMFASTHTCLPALRIFDNAGQRRLVVNNGAAGMPNFDGVREGIVTRIGIHRSPHAVRYGECLAGVYVDALPVAYDHARWENIFLSNWPAGSPAYASYYERIMNGPDYSACRACRSLRVPMVISEPVSGYIDRRPGQ